MSSRDELIGNSRRNLVLKTAGIIRVLVGDKYYNIDFRSEKEEQEDKDEEITSNFIIANNINGYKNGIIDYPGDGKIIFTLDGGIYYTKKYKYNEYDFSNSLIKESEANDFDNTVNFNAKIPFAVKNSNLIQNLNAQYINGKTSDDFITKSHNISLDNLTVKSISSDDGLFSYNDGILNIPNHEINSISNKVTLGDVKIISVKELEYSKVLPYKNDLLFDVLDAIWDIEDKDFTLISELLNVVNSDDLDLSLLSGLSKDKQYDALSNLNNIYFTINRNGDWDSYDSLKIIFNKYVKEIDDHKASFELSVSNSSYFNIYQTFTANIDITAYKSEDGSIIYNSCLAGDDYEEIIESRVINCVVTSVSDNYISITTDYESKLYSLQEEITESGSFLGKDYKYTIYVEPYEESDNYEKYNCLSGFDIKDFNIKSGIIGDLSGEVFDGINLSGFGLMIKDNVYISNPYIRNNIIYKSLDQEYTLEIPEIRDYSILSNGNKVNLPDSELNGLLISIYANDDINLNNGDVILKGEYASYRLIPVSQDTYKWIRI